MHVQVRIRSTVRRMMLSPLRSNKNQMLLIAILFQYSGVRLRKTVRARRAVFPIPMGKCTTAKALVYGEPLYRHLSGYVGPAIRRPMKKVLPAPFFPNVFSVSFTTSPSNNHITPLLTTIIVLLVPLPFVLLSDRLGEAFVCLSSICGHESFLSNSNSIFPHRLDAILHLTNSASG